MVLTLWVIFSPTTPSPLVAALTNLPCSYSRETDKPSIFNSQTYWGLMPSFFILSSKFTTSLSLKTSLNDIIGILWVTFLKESRTSPPTLFVGESSLANSLYFCSSSSNSRKYLSYSWSVIVGSSKT